MAKGDSSANFATTAFTRANGMQAFYQQVLTGPTYVLGLADAGHDLLCGGLTGVTFPNGAIAASQGTYWLANTGTTDVTLTIPGGTDFRNVLKGGEAVCLAGDGNGFFRTVSQGFSNTSYNLAVNGWDRLPSVRIEEWGTSGSVPANGSLAVTFPKSFSTLWNITLTPTGSAGTGGMAYAYPLSQTVNGFSIFNAGASAVSFYWRATGI
jgi:hypothetical protein